MVATAKLAFLIPIAAIPILAGGCKEGNGTTCGAGTQAVNGVCVPSGTQLTCGAGTQVMNSVCVPSASPVTCGAGTQLESGVCVPIGTPVTCGAGTQEMAGACVPSFPERICGEKTVDQNGTCVSSVIEPAPYTSPIVQLQRIAANNDHMHLDEVRFVAAGNTQRVYVCSYDFAVLNVANPASVRYLLQQQKVVWPAGQGFRTRYPATGTRTGGCINLAVDGEYVYTTHRGNIDDPSYLGGWQITGTNSLTARQIPLHSEPGVSFEGVEFANGHLYVGLGRGGFAVYDHDRVTDTFTKRGTLGGLNHVLGLRVANNRVYAADGLGGLVVIDVTDPDAPALLGRVDTIGQARDVRVDVRADRTTVYVAAANAGLVIVDATDPARMNVIGQATMPSSAQRLDYVADRVYVAAWNDIRMFDVADPTSPRFIAAARMTRQLPGTTAPDQDGRPEVTSRTLGITASTVDPNIVFAGNWHIPYSFRLHADRLAPYIFLPEEINLMDFGPIPMGQAATKELTIRNDGTAPLNVFNIYTSNPDAFKVEPYQATIAPASSATFVMTYTSHGSEKENAILYIQSDDPTQPLRKGYMVGNQGGLGVGVPLPETTVALTDGGEWSSTSPENTGKVQMLAYFATF